MVADRAENGRARPYELGDVAYALRQVLSRRAVDALAWLVACEKGFGGKRGVVVKHADLARMLACSERSAGAAMRELLELDLVEQRPHFVPADDATNHHATDAGSRRRRWREHTPAYQTTARAASVLSKRQTRLEKRSGRSKSRGSLLVGKSYQPAESAAKPLVSHLVGVPGRGRPEQAFVAEVLDSRKAPTAPRPVAIVWDRRSPGSPSDGTISNAELAARKLLTERSLEVPARRRHPTACDCTDCVTAAVNSAFASWLERENGGDAQN